MGARLAIDFGTSNTVVSIWDDATGRPRGLHLPGLSSVSAYNDQEMYVVPSIIHYDQLGNVLVGEEVIKRRLDTAGSTMRRMKSYVRSSSITNLYIGGKRLSYQDAAMAFLHRVMDAAQKEIGEVPESIALTVPVESFEEYNKWITDAVEMAQARPLRLIDEPVAAAMGYGARASDSKPWMIFDFGGGTLDVAMVMFDIDRGPSPSCRVLGKFGVDLGGEDIDGWLADEVLRRRALARGTNDFDQVRSLVVKECRLLKERLSTKMSGDITVMNPMTGAVLQDSVSRAELETILERKDVYSRIDKAIKVCLDAAEHRGFSADDIERVVMVGGGSLIPSVQQRLRARFGERLLLERPLDAVATGACMLLTGQRCIDFINHSYAIKSRNSGTGTHEYHIIVPSGTEYPSDGSLVLKKIAATTDNQRNLGLSIYEISTTEYLQAKNGGGDRTKISDHELKGLKHSFVNSNRATFLEADPPARLGEYRFEIEFTLDENRRLLVTTRDILTGRTLHRHYPVIKLR